MTTDTTARVRGTIRQLEWSDEDCEECRGEGWIVPSYDDDEDWEMRQTDRDALHQTEAPECQQPLHAGLPRWLSGKPNDPSGIRCGGPFTLPRELHGTRQSGTGDGDQWI